MGQTLELRAAAARNEGLDALRGLAAVAVVMLHASMPYLLRPMPGLVWPTHDARPSAAVDAIGWAIESCIMPLFLVLAGLFAAGLVRRLGPARFARHRTRRLLAPLLLGTAVIVPLDFWVWVLGFLIDERCTWRHVRRMKFPAEIHRDLFGLSHLWFLQYLYLLSLGLAAWRVMGAWRWRGAGWNVPNPRPGLLDPAVGEKDDQGSANPQAGWGSGWSSATLVGFLIALGGVLWWEPNIVVGFQHAFWPVLPKFVHATLFFTLGVWLDGDAARSRQIVRTRHAWLAVAAAAFVVLLPRIHAHQAAALARSDRIEFAAAAALFAVSMTFGAYGAFLKIERVPAWTKRLAEASFWIYLAHHPLVGLIQIALAKLPWLAEIKFLVVTGLTLTLTLASEATLVRHTWLGTLSYGPRQRAVPTERPPAAASGRAGESTSPRTRAA